MFLKTNKIDVKGKKSIDWLGVPLKIDNEKTIGSVVIQSYDKKKRFTEKDEKILIMISLLG